MQINGHSWDVDWQSKRSLPRGACHLHMWNYYCEVLISHFLYIAKKNCLSIPTSLCLAHCHFILFLDWSWRAPCWFWWQLCWDELIWQQTKKDPLRTKAFDSWIHVVSRDGQGCTLSVLMNCPSLFGLLMLLSYCILFYTSLLFLFELVCKVCHSQSQREGSKVYEFISQKLYH